MSVCGEAKMGESQIVSKPSEAMYGTLLIIPRTSPTTDFAVGPVLVDKKDDG